MNESTDIAELVAYYQVLCKAIQFFEPMGWTHPAIQEWLKTQGLEECRSPWQLPPAALWVMVQSLEVKLDKLQHQR